MLSRRPSLLLLLADPSFPRRAGSNLLHKAVEPAVLVRLGVSAELGVGEDTEEDGKRNRADKCPAAEEGSSSGRLRCDLAVSDGAVSKERSALPLGNRRRLTPPRRDEAEVEGDEVGPVEIQGT